MIPTSDIVAWQSNAPWRSNLQVEHDLILSRALVEIYKVPAIAEGFALRGGATPALHLDARCGQGPGAQLFFDFRRFQQAAYAHAKILQHDLDQQQTRSSGRAR